MGRGIIELPMEDVVLFIKNVAHREQWDKHLLVGVVIRQNVVNIVVYLFMQDIAVVCEFSSTDFLGMHLAAKPFNQICATESITSL